jgi:hypothetical protein
MRTDVDRDVAVDVLVVGAGIPALHIAQALHPTYSVGVVSEPGVTYESYESSGRFAAGYAGNDVSRIQPARRAAGYWRLWAESHGIAHDPAPSLHALAAGDEAVRTRRWAEAGLASHPVGPGRLPAVLARGPLGRRPVYATPDDVVMDPARVAAELRGALGDRVVAATVERFRLITPQAVDVVELSLGDDRTVPVAARFVVFASDAANAALLLKLAGGMRDRPRRKVVIEAARASQAVRRRPTIVVEGALPPLCLSVDGIDITSQPAGGAGAPVTWLVQLPIDDADTVIGPDDLRFAPPLDGKVVCEGLYRLFELAPGLRPAAPRLRWSAYVARQTEHPMVVDGDPRDVPSPSPARIETVGMDALVAAWPSHLGYAMIVGDVVAERVRAALGAPDVEPGEWPGDLGPPAPAATTARWRRGGTPWFDWPGFAARYGFPV